MHRKAMWRDTLYVYYTTIDRWVQDDAPELDRRCQPYLKITANSCRIDVAANTLDFWLNATRDVEAALLIIPSRSQGLTKAYLLSIL